MQDLSLNFSPLLPESLLFGFCLAVMLLFLFQIFQSRKIRFFRLLCALTFLLVLANPSLIEEEREPVSSTALLITDESISNQVHNRSKETQNAANHIKEIMEARYPNIELREARNLENEKNGTEIFTSLQKSFQDIRPDRRAGVFVITDGQIHDLPENLQNMDDFGPVHFLLTGKSGEKDREIKILEAPSYGIVGKNVDVKFQVLDHGSFNNQNARVSILKNEEDEEFLNVLSGQDYTISLPITKAGDNLFEIRVDPVNDELTDINNAYFLKINGVRDRLKVLLVSGKPHAGGRNWRNLLTSDPGVDLVHFTILREPEKLDATPQNELSLIAFPFRELFELKLYDFDLIIFDRYKLNRILPDYYFANIARYVREGGALLEASGPSFAGSDSIFSTALQPVFPGTPTGEVFERHFKPSLTETGKRHPVTQDLGWPEGRWGHWLRQVDIEALEGDIIMKGLNDRPLLILNKVGKGRVAQLASDHIWLWSRGYDGGGPHAELLRRTAHWLMKEPALDEKSLSAFANGKEIFIQKRSLEQDEQTVTITGPNNFEKEIMLQRDENGRFLTGRVQVNDFGVYKIFDNERTSFVTIGNLNNKEFQSLISTAEKVKDIAEHTNGSVKRLENMPKPEIRYLPENRNYVGRNWIALRDNKAYTVSGVQENALFKPWIALFFLAFFILLTWWMEGGKRSAHRAFRRSE